MRSGTNRPLNPTEDPVVTATDPSRRVASPTDAAGALALLLPLLCDPRGAFDLREAALALRDLAATLERIASRREMPCPGGSYNTDWAPYRGA